MPLPSSPQSLPEFEAMFPDEQACVRYLFNVRWPNGDPCGAECKDGPLSWYEGGRVIYCALCKRKVSLTAGTVMHGSHTPLRTWFHAAFLVSTLTPGISAVQLQAQLGLSRYETAFQILHKLRAGMVDPDRSPLSGIVEVDESFVGGVQHGGEGGRSLEGRTAVVAAVEVRPSENEQGYYAGRLRLRVIENTGAGELDDFFRDHVAPGSVVWTDGWQGYRNLKAMGYDHRPQVGAGLPVIHREFANLKTWLQGTHHGRVERQHLQAYLHEFAFRHNRRFWKFDAFRRALAIGSETQAPTYDEIYSAEGAGRNVHKDEPATATAAVPASTALDGSFAPGGPRCVPLVPMSQAKPGDLIRMIGDVPVYLKTGCTPVHTRKAAKAARARRKGTV